VYLLFLQLWIFYNYFILFQLQIVRIVGYAYASVLQKNNDYER